MVITGLATYSKINFYSEQFVVNYLWVSRIDHTTSNQAYAVLRYDLRKVAILASVLMSTVFQGLVENYDGGEDGKLCTGMADMVVCCAVSVDLEFGQWQFCRRVGGLQCVCRLCVMVDYLLEDSEFDAGAR
jgi:hypothetical protein